MVSDRFIAGHQDLRCHLDSVPPDTPIRDIVDQCRESHSDTHNMYRRLSTVTGNYRRSSTITGGYRGPFDRTDSPGGDSSDCTPGRTKNTRCISPEVIGSDSEL